MTRKIEEPTEAGQLEAETWEETEEEVVPIPTELKIVIIHLFRTLSHFRVWPCTPQFRQIYSVIVIIMSFLLSFT